MRSAVGGVNAAGLSEGEECEACGTRTKARILAGGHYLICRCVRPFEDFEARAHSMLPRGVVWSR